MCHTFVDSVLGWYRRHFEARRLSGSKGGAVTTVQRVSSDLRLNPHFHTLCLDGVYVEDEDGKLIFHPLPCLTNGDVADILQIASTRILRLLRYKGVVEDDMINADESLTESDPALAELAVASTLGRVPAGPALRKREPIRLRPGRDLEHTKGLCATAHRFSLHAATTARAEDAAGREARANVYPVGEQTLSLGVARPQTAPRTVSLGPQLHRYCFRSGSEPRYQSPCIGARALVEPTRLARFPERSQQQSARLAETYLEAMQSVRWIHDELLRLAEDAEAVVLPNIDRSKTLTNAVDFLSRELPIDEPNTLPAALANSSTG